MVKLADGKIIEYIADANNRRIAKIENGKVVRKYLYSGQLSPIAEMDSADNIKVRYVYATRENVPDYFIKNDTTYRIITDHLGSVRVVVNNATGEVVQKIDYDEFGNITKDSNPEFQPFGYCGGLYEKETGLTRFGARDYEAVSGRWTAKEPLGFAGSNNFYSYVDNDPVNWVDLNGLDKLYFNRKTLTHTNDNGIKVGIYSATSGQVGNTNTSAKDR